MTHARAALLITAGAVALVGGGASATLAGASSVAPHATFTRTPVDVRRTPVVFVSLDEFALASLLEAPGVIDARRFPGFAALARESTWFANTTPSADGTRWATPAVLAGVRPVKRRIPAWTDYRTNLFTLLGRTHRMVVEEPLTRLCPPSLCPGHTLPGRTRRQRARVLAGLIPAAKQAALRRSALAAFVRDLRPWRRGRPPLHYIDVLMPHHPYVWLPDGRRYAPPAPPMPGMYGDNMWRDDQALVNRAWQRYLLQVGYTDLLIGRLVRRLKAIGMWDRALVVVLPDHGVSFLPGRSRRTATAATLGGIGVIPFFVKLPGQTLGGRIDAHVETMDVLPTVAGALGLRRPRGVDGHDALAPGFRPSPSAELWSTTSVVTFGRHVYSMALVQRRLAELVARQRATFGRHAFSGRFFRLGPRADLVGRPARRLPPGSRRIGFGLEQLADGAPAVVSGAVAGVGADRTLALVVRGRVAATTRTYAFGGVRFSAAIPRGGELTVYALP